MSKSMLLDRLTPQTARAIKCAEIYFMMMRTEGIAPKLSTAMVRAGYSPRTAGAKQKEMVQNRAFRAELQRLEEAHFDYQKTLEKVRNKGILELQNTDFDKEKRRDVMMIANTTNEMLRLERGQSTENVAISAILNEIEDEKPPDDTAGNQDTAK